MKRKMLGKLSLLCLLFAASLGVSAQDFPARTVKIIVPQTPGGASDTLARIIGQQLSEKWGQPVVIENKSGAGGNVGTELAATSSADGSVNHLLGEMFNAAADVKITHIPYRGAAPAMTDLMGGQIDIVYTSLPSVAGSLKSGKLRAIAVSSAKRAASFDSIPTIAEAGFPGFDVNPWFGLLAPAGTPTDVVAKINKDVNDLLKTKTVADSFAAQGAEPYLTSPEEFTRVLRADIGKWGKVVKDS